MRGVDARILASQVPGGMLTNLENQLKSQNSIDRFDEVIKFEKIKGFSRIVD